MRNHQDTLTKHSSPGRSRRLGVVGGALAVIAVVAAAFANQAVAEDTTGTSLPSTSSGVPRQGAGVGQEEPDSTKPDSAHEQPVSGIGALEAALSRVAPEGVVSDPSKMNYEPSRDGWPNAWGSLTFASSEGAASATVGVNYWPAKEGDAELYSQCMGLVDDCEMSTLPDGSVVITYVIAPLTFVPGQDNGPAIAAHRIVNGTVVALMATAPGKGTDPVLTRAQLEDLISQPEWADLESVK
jgi:hypothetical protein